MIGDLSRRELGSDNEPSQVAVISGIGVRDYYKKQGYELRGTYMIKKLPLTWEWGFLVIAFNLVLLI